jgi:hypothetical protein
MNNLWLVYTDDGWSMWKRKTFLIGLFSGETEEEVIEKAKSVGNYKTYYKAQRINQGFVDIEVANPDYREDNDY